MAAETGTVWAIDIGNNSLKALCLSTERGIVEVVGFDSVQHGKILSSGNVTDAEKEELIALSFRELVTKYDLSMDEIVVSVPSQNSFIRFVNLPPVEAKRIPEMVKFEAVQQIPFGINDVQWDWQLMSEVDSPEIKVGIFAIKNEIVDAALNPLSREDIEVSYVQIAPMALYNYMVYDRPDLIASDNQAVVVLNVGAENTDLVVCTKSTVWQRCILLGGNTFTHAIADTFKLNFDKAEKLKRTAPMSKYARQIFQAMRPVFNDLASEVQRSLGFYNSANPNTKIKKIVAIGGGTKLRGIHKYLQQTLQMPVERPDSFKRLALGPGVSQAQFHENVTDFGVVYGLALQGLGLAKIESNLLPRNIARSREWASKGRYFITAACLLLAVSILSFGRTLWDKMNYDKQSNIRTRFSRTLGGLTDSSDRYIEIQNKKDELAISIDKEFGAFKYRDINARLFGIINKALPNEDNNPDQAELYQAFANSDAKAVKKIPRNDRKQVFITNLVSSFTSDLEATEFPDIDFTARGVTTYGTPGRSTAQNRQDAAMQRQREMEIAMLYGDTTVTETVEKESGFLVTITGYTPYGNNKNEVINFLDPSKVEDGMNKWGFITRLLYMDELSDADSPFELYNKVDSKNYSLVVQELDKNTDYPVGTGIEEEENYSTSSVYGTQQNPDIPLIDPLTKEIISKETQVDESGRTVDLIHDHWFTLKMKFLWKEAPEPPEIPLQ